MKGGSRLLTGYNQSLHAKEQIEKRSARLTGIHPRMPARYQQTLLALEEKVESEKSSITFFRAGQNSLLISTSYFQTLREILAAPYNLDAHQISGTA